MDNSELNNLGRVKKIIFENGEIENKEDISIILILAKTIGKQTEIAAPADFKNRHVNNIIGMMHIIEDELNSANKEFENKLKDFKKTLLYKIGVLDENGELTQKEFKKFIPDLIKENPHLEEAFNKIENDFTYDSINEFILNNKGLTRKVLKGYGLNPDDLSIEKIIQSFKERKKKK